MYIIRNIMNNSFLPQQLGLGARIASERKALGLRALSAARSAGISRVTLHRIEKGETSDEQAPQNQQAKTPLTFDGPNIRIGDYSQLTALAWQLDVNTLLTDVEARGIYERNKRFLDVQQINSNERTLMQRLIAEKDMENLLV
jgi:transcriptional regulator with XRE-family HTH domain